MNFSMIQVSEKKGIRLSDRDKIERILPAKPEEQRELFDEAAGIVKFKRRKQTAQKKLENEQQNLIRVNDILSDWKNRSDLWNDSQGDGQNISEEKRMSFENL